MIILVTYIMITTQLIYNLYLQNTLFMYFFFDKLSQIQQLRHTKLGLFPMFASMSISLISLSIILFLE